MKKDYILKCFVLILFSTYSSFSKNLKLADLCKIEIGMKLSTVEKNFGKPQSVSTKSNSVYTIYGLENNTKIKLTYLNNKLTNLHFIDFCKREFKLEQKKKLNKLPIYRVSKGKKTISLEDFCKIQKGYSHEKIEQLIGCPTSTQGSGLIWDIYDFQDDSYIKLFYSNNILSILAFVDPCGREYSLSN